MPASLAERLLAHWIEHGAKPNPGCGEEELRAFEGRHGVVVPPDLRAMYLCADGMNVDVSGNQDEEGFSFWPLSQVKTVEAEAPGKHATAIDEPGRYFVFADYMAWSWAYAIRLDEGVSGEQPVVMVGVEDRVQVARSFTEFAERYLVDDPALYGPDRQ